MEMEDAFERIMDKISEIVEDDNVKSFLKGALGLERKHQDEAKWRRTADYESLIEGHLEQ
jgi:hypothetical protein